MGKNLITQRRGRGSPTYRAPSHKFYGEIKFRKYDEAERTGVMHGKIKDIVACPGHTAPLAKVVFENREEILMSAPEKIRVNDVISSGAESPVATGNVLPLRKIPEGTLIFNIEALPGDGGKFVRTSGSFAKVVNKVGENVTVLLPSSKQKGFNGNCRAAIGVIAGGGKKEKPLLKAGKVYHMKRAKNKLYPRTSGVAMNAVDHPFGSGRGRHVGKPKTPPRFASAGRNVGLIRARRTGHRN